MFVFILFVQLRMWIRHGIMTVMKMIGKKRAVWLLLPRLL